MPRYYVSLVISEDDEVMDECGLSLYADSPVLAAFAVIQSRSDAFDPAVGDLNASLQITTTDDGDIEVSMQDTSEELSWVALVSEEE